MQQIRDDGSEESAAVLCRAVLYTVSITAFCPHPRVPSHHPQIQVLVSRNKSVTGRKAEDGDLLDPPSPSERRGGSGRGTGSRFECACACVCVCRVLHSSCGEKKTMVG
ncbi:hypothetical protein PLESTB_000443900 [Pleodorina starrii]|uniref:Uncharacterized protein n=1 Tax=Pleodorina starrii TaxID=330485 RepID=A0A9W6EZB5_9CHLO|nr:hypothetical protein PLESTB_000443900 [Pleodorina starrii]